VTATLPPQPWMTAPATRAVFDALEAVGGPDCARFVGGCVRNTLRAAPVADIDIATRLTPDQVMDALKAAGLRVIPTGVEHGTVTAVVKGQPFEITTLRRDVETDGRRAVVAFSTDWAEDAQRRDFRLNALYADRQGQIHDYVGGGVEDAIAGRVVFVGDAETRIREDYLRILRFFRFYAWYGGEAPDAAGLQACAALKDGVGRLSAERVSRELLKLLEALDPRDALRLMAQTGVLAVVLPARLSLERFDAMVGLSGDPVLRLSALLPDDPAVVLGVAEGLRLSNSDRDRLVAAAGATVDLGLTQPQARAAIYRDGAGVFRDRVQRALATQTARRAEAYALLAFSEAWTPPKFPLGGREALELGATGPKVGRVLRAVEDWWIAQDFPIEGAHDQLRAAVAAKD
jgi:poly(A) polymerase